LLQGISQTIGNAGGIVGVPAAAVIAEVAGWDAVFLFLAFCYGTSVIIFWKWGTAKLLF